MSDQKLPEEKMVLLKSLFDIMEEGSDRALMPFTPVFEDPEGYDTGWLTMYISADIVDIFKTEQVDDLSNAKQIALGCLLRIRDKEIQPIIDHLMSTMTPKEIAES